MVNIKNCVILTAGLGSRLGDLTESKPKCLLEIEGVSILERTLCSLEKNGIERTVIVIGYLGYIIRDKFGSQYAGTSLTYINNDIFSETNSMYSTWLARDYLEDGSLLIEGDTIFEEALIRKALNSDAGKAYWVLDRFRPEHDGSLCVGKPDEPIEQQMIVRDKLPEYKDTYFKSTGVVKITADYGKLFSIWLDNAVKQDDVKIYYDTVISRHLGDFPIYVLDIAGLRWIEVDTQQDLLAAQELFSIKA